MVKLLFWSYARLDPAEIIGTKPRPLALSLYQELITNHVWSENRKKYGYRDLSQFHLMTTFYGTPYVDVRIDFNSWIPLDLNEKISQKIIKYYLKKFNKTIFMIKLNLKSYLLVQLLQPKKD